LLAVLFASCNASRVVKPLDKGEKAVSASFGGPNIIYAGSPMPLPLTSVAYAHGIDTGLTIAAGLHMTDLAFGVIHTDVVAGINAYKSKSENFGVTVSPGLHFLVDVHETNFRTYPQLDALCWWNYLEEKEHHFYGGIGTWIELNKAKAHGEVQTNELMPYLMLGHQFEWSKWNLQLEGRFIGFQHKAEDIVVDYVPIGGQGTTGIYIGVGRRFGK